MSDENSKNDLERFSITVNLDRDGFFRRTCPSCGRDFKTEGDPADTVTVLSPQISKVGLEIGESTNKSDPESPHTLLGCPYCEHRAEPKDMLTSEVIEYLKRHAVREIRSKLDKAFNDLSSSMGSKGRGGLFSLSLKFEYSRSPLPSRPIHGPEPADMKIINLLCCDKKIKISKDWMSLDLCPYCETRIVVV